MEMRSCLNTEAKSNEVMGNCKFDISDSEFMEYKDAVYKLIKFGNYKVRVSNGGFVCPFCVGEEKQGYYRLLEHVVRVAEGSTGSGKKRANHSAMAKYLVIDLKAEMLNCENEKKLRQVALTEEKRKMDDSDRLNNDEILKAEKELIKGLENMPSHCRVKFGVKKRGEIDDEKAFMDACKKRHLLNEIETKAFERCCFWVKKWRDAKRLPTEKDVLQRGINDYWNNKIYNAVAEYITNGNGMELWNFEEDRKASHCEVIRYVFSQWKTLQCERDELIEVIHSPRTTSMAYREEDESDEESSENEGCPDPKADKWNAKKVRKAKNDPMKPKPPPSAFVVFMEKFLEIYNEIDPTYKSIAAVEKAGGDMWKSMSQAEKAPYQAKAEKKKQEYEKLMIAYNTKQDSSSDEGSERSSDSELEEDDTCSSEA